MAKRLHLDVEHAGQHVGRMVLDIEEQALARIERLSHRLSATFDAAGKLEGFRLLEDQDSGITFSTKKGGL